ncbi:fimbrial assembly protein FimA [Anoxybacter fermentans]|uniref:Fimbrial assembly protein FimA n=2 Tax=Anoxybacter fermentans TaxID=1323375 RepID=A0A3S9T2U0_9FIRM|nr:fimbrial assembly protein FimA [Anoxybacter fermentans]
MKEKELVATFSIVGFDPETGELGIAVQSKFLAVGAVVPWARAGVGAIATQSWANTTYGPEGLRLLEEGYSVEEVLEKLTSADENKNLRQVGIVDAKGNSATFTGEDCFEWAGGIAGPNFAAQGNILVSEETVKAMADTFVNVKGPLADRLVEALAAGQAAGGDSRGRQSAALLVVKEKGGYSGFNDRYIDLRVDDHPTPIKELKRLLNLFYLYFRETDPDKLVKIEGEQLKEIQQMLKKLDFYQGEITGEWNEEFKESLKTFYMKENFEGRMREDEYIDSEILDYMRYKAGLVK